MKKKKTLKKKFDRSNVAYSDAKQKCANRKKSQTKINDVFFFINLNNLFCNKYII